VTQGWSKREIQASLRRALRLRLRQRERVARALARLRRLLPLPHPVAVVWASTDASLYGSCERLGRGRRRRFRITLDPGQCETIAEAVDTLLHEYAHAMSWHDVPSQGDHGDAWGLAYALCYRKFWRVR